MNITRFYPMTQVRDWLPHLSPYFAYAVTAVVLLYFVIRAVTTLAELDYRLTRNRGMLATSFVTVPVAVAITVTAGIGFSWLTAGGLLSDLGFQAAPALGVLYLLVSGWLADFAWFVALSAPAPWLVGMLNSLVLIFTPEHGPAYVMQRRVEEFWVQPILTREARDAALGS